MSIGTSTTVPSLVENLPENLFPVPSNPESQQQSLEQEKDLANFSHGILSYERGDFDEAKAYLVSSLAQVELAPYTYFYLGKIAFEVKNLNAALAAYEEALKFKPHSDLLRNIKYEMAKTLIAKNRWAQAKVLLLDARRRFKRTELYPEIIAQLFVIDRKLNSQSQCFWFRSLFESYPNHELASTWTLDSKTWKHEDKDINCALSFNTKYRHVSQLIALGDYDSVKRELEIAKLTMPRLDYLELLVSYDLRAGNPEEAFNELKLDFEKESKNPKFLQLYIKVASRALKSDEALAAYDLAIGLEKNPRIKAGLVFRKGFFEYELGFYENSYETLMSVQKSFANNPYQGDITWYLGWTAYLQKKYDVAITHFEVLEGLIKRRKYIRSRDNYSKERVNYWLAQTYRALGDNDKAYTLMQEVVDGEKLSYYAFLASAYLPEIDSKLNKSKKGDKNQALLSNLSVPWLKIDSEKKSDGQRNYVLKDEFNPNFDVYISKDQEALLDQAFDQEKHQMPLKRFKLLLKSGFYDDARFELQELEKKASSKNQKLQLVQMYRRLDDLHRASRIMTLSFQNERQNILSDDNLYDLWFQTFPKPHQKAVLGSSDQFQVPEHLVYSIMRAESFYSKTAMSGVGARGLLQLMPFTAKQVAELMGKAQDVKPEQLFEPDTNIQLGVKYLNRLLKSFAGDKILAIAAYNAGPHRAEWWVSRFGHLRQDEFIEHIMFLETRNYVKKVMQFNWTYDLLYSNQATFAEIKSPIEFQLSGAPSLVEKW